MKHFLPTPMHLLILCILFFAGSVLAGVPVVPTELTAVPVYGNNQIKLNWKDNANNETGYRIERKNGGGFVSIATLGADSEEYLDGTINQGVEYTYRVVSYNADGDSGYSNEDKNILSVTWTLSNGNHEMMNSWQDGTPANSWGFHEGIDIQDDGNGGQVVVAARGGVISLKASSNPCPGDNVAMQIMVGNKTFYDLYCHMEQPTAKNVGETVSPGEQIGKISTTAYSQGRRHVHQMLFEDKYEVFTTQQYFRGPLSIFSQSADQDPGGNAPGFEDVDGDGHTILYKRANGTYITDAKIYGDVDISAELTDNMGSNPRQGPHRAGYWVEGLPLSSEGIRSATAPYILHNFDNWFGEAIGQTNFDAIYDPDKVLSTDIIAKRFHHILTNTKGTDGSVANLDSTQFWRTNARKGTGTQPNGSNSDKARENQEAKFLDGTYFVHVVSGDMVHSSDDAQSVLIDNSRPYVQKVTVYSGARIVYQAKWVWDSGAAQLKLQPATFDAAAPFTALRTQDVIVEVEFSEPMQTASITALTPLNKIPTLASEQPENARTVWKGIISNLDIADDGSNDGTHMITINGTDLAGNKLLQINNHNTMPADHHNRDAGGNLKGTVGTDTIHGFRIGSLEGVIPVTAIFMKQTATDPATPTVTDKALLLQTALNNYFSEVSYGKISFAVTGHGWYQLQHPLTWYYSQPQTPLVDLVQEAVQAAENNGNAITSGNYVLVVTDENTSRDEWSIGGWPYTLASTPSQLLAPGVLNLASSDAHVTNLAGRMVGLIDLFHYPEVTVARDFVAPWSHMSDKDHAVHVLGWEKWRAGWLDETSTATGNTLTRVDKPSVGSPIVDQNYTIKPIDTDDDSVKMVAIAIGNRLHYTAEYRRKQNLDSVLPDSGVLITKTNDYINQGEGTAIVQESPVSAGDISDATFNLTASRNTFNDVGSGVNITVNSLDANEAEIKLNYTIPPKENDVFVSPHDERWKAEDIWIDAPALDGSYEADPFTVKDADEKPVIGKTNKVYGRIRNQGHADASNFETRLEIREPWGVGGPWRSLKVDTIPLVQGQDHKSGDYYLVKGDWTPTGDVHSCVKLEAVGVANDINKENNWTQENISEFVTTKGSPFAPVTSRFEVENPFNETITVFFKVEGLPSGWSSLLTPQRLVIPAKGVGSAQVTIQPSNAAPLCSKDQITISANTPRVDTLKSLGAITLQTALKNSVGITGKSWVQCGERSKETMVRTAAVEVHKPSFGGQCALITQGCTDPKQPNTQVAVVYTAPDGSTQVRYVMTDANGCYQDFVQGGEPGLWQTQVVLEETDCRAEAKAPTQSVVIPSPEPFSSSWWCLVMWSMFVLSVIAAIVFFAMWWCTRAETLYRCFVATLAAVFIGWILLTGCHFNACWFLLSVILAVVIAAFWIYVFCFRRKRNNVITH